MAHHSLEFANTLDAKASTLSFASHFIIPQLPNGKPTIYMCGNSLGLQPRIARERVLEVLDDWGKWGVEGHIHAHRPWLPFHERVCENLALVMGALPQEVVAMNSLTVNLHLMLISFYKPTKQRRKIAIEEHAFPSDVYAAKSQLAFHGFDPEKDLLVLHSRAGEDTLRTEDILETLKNEGETIATLLMGGVNYYTGQAFDIENITKTAQEQGIVVGWDLAHAAGNLHLQLHDHGPDFAAWCSYKYLNSGPGGIAGVFVHQRHLGRTDITRFEGWWGTNKETRFQMHNQFEPIPTVEAWQLSNPPILPLATLEASLELFQQAGMLQLREKSIRLSNYLETLLNDLDDSRLQIITPSDPNQRGAQLSVRIHGGNRSLQAQLLQNGVICDWREPDTIRLAPAPLYNSFTDVWHAVEALKQVIIA